MGFDSLEGRVNELLSLSLGSSTARELAQELVEIAAQHNNQVKHLFSRQTLTDDRDLQHSILTHQLNLNYLTQVLENLEGAQTRRVPWSFITTAEYLSRKLLPSRKIVISSTFHSTYRIVYTAKVPQKGIERFDIIEIPSAQRTNGHLHHLVGHELFHPVVDPWVGNKAVDVSSKLLELCSEYHNTANERPDVLLDRALASWKAAIKELMCDFGCAALFGPSILFSMMELGYLHGFDDLPGSGASHPSYRHRLNAIWKHVFDSNSDSSDLQKVIELLKDNNKLEIASLFSQWLDSFDRSIVSTTIGALAKDDFTNAVYQFIDDYLASAWEFVKENTENVGLYWANDVTEIASHYGHFAMNVPSGEIQSDEGELLSRKAGCISAIMISSWLAELRRTNDLPKPESGISPNHFAEKSRQGASVSSRLLFKSLEDADLKRRVRLGFEVPLVDDKC